ncbi:MAG: TetR/AcrR family transcriptional regulator [Acidimicrobiia bacterium]|nr:TetR/AcrR family transcriptional regulator [Acidimicrobiia bacterium]MDH5503303.1 TetR/AcrR family transcriptional regulator [Acidimicrobiia bacterium]
MSRLSRDDVIEAAGRLFAKRGYHATSMRDLGGELGILGGSVYAHVSSKEELLVEVVQRAGRLFGESAARAMSSSDHPEEQLRALIGGHIRVVLDHRDEAQTFLNEATALGERHRQAIVEERDTYEAHYRSVITNGITAGTFRSDVDANLAATFVLSILNAIERWYQPDGRVDPVSLADQLHRFALSGVLRSQEELDAE